MDRPARLPALSGLAVLLLGALPGCARPAPPAFQPSLDSGSARDGAGEPELAELLDAPADAPLDQRGDGALDAPPDGSLDASSDAASDLPRGDLPQDLPDLARSIDHCYLVDPAVLEAPPGGPGPVAAVLVFAASLTPGPGAGAGVAVEVGVGAGGSDPLTAPSWRWLPASYERDVDGAGATGSREYDRHQGPLPLPSAAGEHAFAARARVGAGPWTACDLVRALPHRYDPAFAGRLTVVPAGALRVAYCNLQFPRSLTVPAGMRAAMPAFGRVYAEGVTTRGCDDRPASAELAAQFGFGPEGSYPSDATWTWLDAAYSDHRDSTSAVGRGDCRNIEYVATVTAPTTCAPRAYAYRFRRASGPWSYCRWAPPAEGAPTTPPWDVFVPSLAGTLTVTGCP